MSEERPLFAHVGKPRERGGDRPARLLTLLVVAAIAAAGATLAADLRRPRTVVVEVDLGARPD